jgi:acyl carrier protein
MRRMERSEIRDKIVEIIGTYAKDKDAVANVTDETNILEDLKVNSARLVDVILDFEDAFDIEVEDEDADSVNTVGDAVNLVAAKVA